MHMPNGSPLAAQTWPQPPWLPQTTLLQLGKQPASGMPLDELLLAAPPLDVFDVFDDDAPLSDESADALLAAPDAAPDAAADADADEDEDDDADPDPDCALDELAEAA